MAGRKRPHSPDNSYDNVDEFVDRHFQFISQHAKPAWQVYEVRLWLRYDSGLALPSKFNSKQMRDVARTIIRRLQAHEENTSTEPEKPRPDPKLDAPVATRTRSKMQNDVKDPS
ncbi:hypothetical protein OPT61_g8976 [Boeremia exigua]|uniref:Uncharacterized protein n=1 Tax=Boeremia exigua TaxID=749465 RepID=A0ACC2HW36_9PLEO|nr:hypothetical protein OPT61_g8976 [Boeremia exigua]